MMDDTTKDHWDFQRRTKRREAMRIEETVYVLNSGTVWEGEQWTETIVTRITATQITVATGQRFSRVHGREIGGDGEIFAADEPTSWYGGKPAAQVAAEWRAHRGLEQEAARLIRILRNVDARKVSIETLREMVAVLKRAQEAKQ